MKSSYNLLVLLNILPKQNLEKLHTLVLSKIDNREDAFKMYIHGTTECALIFITFVYMKEMTENYKKK